MTDQPTPSTPPQPCQAKVEQMNLDAFKHDLKAHFDAAISVGELSDTDVGYIVDLACCVASSHFATSEARAIEEATRELRKKLAEAEHGVDALSNLLNNCADTLRSRGFNADIGPLDQRVIALAQERDQLRAELNMAEDAKRIAQKERDDAFEFVRKEAADKLFKFEQLTAELAKAKQDIENSDNEAQKHLDAVRADCEDELAEAKKDVERLDWLIGQHVTLRAIKERMEDANFLYWQVTDKNKSLSGHPLPDARAAIDAARAEKEGAS